MAENRRKVWRQKPVAEGIFYFPRRRGLLLYIHVVIQGFSHGLRPTMIKGSYGLAEMLSDVPRVSGRKSKKCGERGSWGKKGQGGSDGYWECGEKEGIGKRMPRLSPLSVTVLGTRW